MLSAFFPPVHVGCVIITHECKDHSSDTEPHLGITDASESQIYGIPKSQLVDYLVVKLQIVVSVETG